MRHTRRSLPLLFALVALAAAAGAASAWEDEEIPCADFISSGADEDPLMGYLVGTEEVTLTIKGDAALSADAKIVTISGGGEVVKTVEYEVGYYRVDGEVYIVDCRSYKLLAVL